MSERVYNRLMGLLCVIALALMACLGVFGQNSQTFSQKVYYASDYGTWDILGQYPNTYLFSPPGVCLIPSPSVGSFIPFNANAPVWIRDAVAANSEVLTPSSVVATESFCGISVTTAHSHTSFSLLSGTGGLQEVLNQIAATIPYPVEVILDRNWYTLVNSVPGQTALNVIAAVHGSTAANLEDVTTAPSTFYKWNGSAYVAQGGTAGSVNYNQGGTGAVTRTSTSKWQDSISIKDFGAVGGDLTLDTAGLQNAVAAATSAGKSVYVPAGTYLLNNAFGPVLSGAKNVVIWGDGPASSLACNTVGGQDCLASTGATGFGLVNLSVSFTPTATTRSSGYAVDIETCTSCLLDGVSLNNGDLSGLRLASSVHTSIHNLRVSNFFANGTFLINDQDLRVDGLSCSNNQDACLETSWFDSEFNAHSIPCEDITATNITSSNDVEAVLINSCRNVTVTNFTSAGSAKEAVFVGQDPTTTTLHWPDRISISNGSIYGSGYGTNPLNAATAQALLVNVGTSPAGFISHIAFSDIVARHIASWGLQMAELQNDDLQMSNLSFYDVGNGNTTGCLLTQGNEINLSGIKCTNVGTYGLYDQNTNRLTGTGLTFNAVNQVSTGVDAVYLANTAVGFVNLTNVNVNDTNATSFTGQIFDASTVGQHSLWNISITYATATGYLGPTAANGGTTYTYTDPGHSMVFRNGGMIQSFVPPNYYFLPTAGATPSAYVDGAVLYYQSKCWNSGQQTESVGWLDTYPTLSTESFSFNQFGGCGFPITINMRQATSVLEPQTQVTGLNSAVHFGGFASGTYASVPTFTGGTGAGTSPTISMNAASSDVSGFVSVTPGATPAASAVVVTGTFGTAYAILAKCSIWPANAAAALLNGTSQVYSPPVSASAFTITAGSAALTQSTLYTWGYTCTQ